MATRDEIKQAMVNRVVTEGLVGPDGQPMPAMDSVLEAVTDGIVMVEGAGPHASTHITGGSDVIPDAVPGGASGLMSGADKAKLDGIEPGAQVNQNAFSYIKVGATTIEADSKTDTLELAAGSNIALTPDAANNKVTIALTGTVPSAQNADTVDSKHASDFALLGHGHTGASDGNQIGTSGLQDGAVTDAKVGNRTVDQAQVPTGSTGTLTQLFSWLANRIKAITGAANWFDSPAATLAAIWGKFHASTGHRHTGAADDGPPIDYANITNKPGSFPPAPHASSHHSGGSDALSLGSIAGTLTDTQHGNRGGGTLHSAATASTAGFMSASDKAKLDGIQSGAEVNQNAFSSVKAVDSGGASKGQADADAKTDVLTLKEGTGISFSVDASTDTITIAATGGGLPAAHASTHITGGTDVIPNAVAGGASGLMSGADKQKLDEIQAGAEVNQNAFSNILVGGTTIAADSKTDTLELVAGTNIALTPDATNDRVTIAVSGTVASASNADTVDGKHASDFVLNSEKGQPNGVATLDANGKVPESQLPPIEGMVVHGNEWHNPGFIPLMSRFRWWHIQRHPSDTVHPNNVQEHLVKIIQALAGKGTFFATSVGTFSSVGDNYHSIGVVRFYANQPVTLDFGVDGDDAVSVYVDGRIVVGWFGPHGTDGLYYKYHNCIATGRPRSTVSESLYPNGYTLMTGWHTLVVLHSEIAYRDSADVYMRLTPSPPEAPGSGTNTGWVHVKDSPDFGAVILYWQEVDPISALQPLIEEYVNYDHIHTNLPLTSIRPAGTNRVVVQNDYGNLTIAPANTGWCHFNTDRPKFWFDRDVAVAGEIWAGPSYNQKVWHAGNTQIVRIAASSATIRYEALTERSVQGTTVTTVKRFVVHCGGIFRVTGEFKVSGSVGYLYVYLNGTSAGYAITTSTSYVSFSIDTSVSSSDAITTIEVKICNSSSTYYTYTRNVRLCYDFKAEPGVTLN